MDLIALALAPGIAICLFIFHRDAYNREPKTNLFVTFILGAVTVVPAALIENSMIDMQQDSIIWIAVRAFLMVALVEELSKFAVLRLYSFPRKSFDEPLDGIVYGVVASMGFATLENVLYVSKYADMGMGYQVAWMRMFLAVPAHATFGVIMGYHVGKAKFDNDNRFKWLFKGVLWATVFHGFYDFFLFLQGTPEVKDYISDTLLFVGAVISFFVAIRLSLKHIKLHRALSQQTFNPTLTMTVRKAYPTDIPLIRDMALKIWPLTYEPILGKEQVDYMLELLYSEKSLMDQMQEQHHQFIVIYDGVAPIGFASFSPISPQAYKLHKIYVLHSYQGKGTGRFAIGQLITAMKKSGATSLILNVNRNNKAKDFYEKLGFTVIREEDIDIGNGYFMNDYVMEKAI
jgi:RsiW-degrading membrane proteinase PrsW (M82 family)/ribosomal protein S18 acetylase RimI-like enzyme